jgi:hypothetical protein
MENQDWVSYKIEVRDRLKRFALDILKFSEMVPKQLVVRLLSSKNQVSQAQKSLHLAPSSSISFNPPQSDLILQSHQS